MGNLNHPENLKYSQTDEWIRIEDGLVVIGITDYAQDQLGDVVYVDLLAWNGDTTVSKEAKFGDIESVKATSELVSPISGEIVSTNEALRDQPELINDDPYDAGWMLKIKPSDPSELDELMSAEGYLNYLQGR
jgi:glycine cleavage system H protein